jgi:hypothetical protein
MAGARVFFSPKHPDWLWGPSIFLSMGTCGFIQEPEYEVHHSRPSNNEDKNEWS